LKLTEALFRYLIHLEVYSLVQKIGILNLSES